MLAVHCTVLGGRASGGSGWRFEAFDDEMRESGPRRLHMDAGVMQHEACSMCDTSPSASVHQHFQISVADTNISTLVGKIESISRHEINPSDPGGNDMTATAVPSPATFDPEVHYGDGDDNALYNLFAT